MYKPETFHDYNFTELPLLAKFAKVLSLENFRLYGTVYQNDNTSIKYKMITAWYSGIVSFLWNICKSVCGLVLCTWKYSRYIMFKDFTVTIATVNLSHVTFFIMYVLVQYDILQMMHEFNNEYHY